MGESKKPKELPVQPFTTEDFKRVKRLTGTTGTYDDESTSLTFEGDTFALLDRVEIDRYYGDELFTMCENITRVVARRDSGVAQAIESGERCELPITKLGKTHRFQLTRSVTEQGTGFMFQRVDSEGRKKPNGFHIIKTPDGPILLKNVETSEDILFEDANTNGESSSPSQQAIKLMKKAENFLEDYADQLSIPDDQLNAPLLDEYDQPIRYRKRRWPFRNMFESVTARKVRRAIIATVVLLAPSPYPGSERTELVHVGSKSVPAPWYIEGLDDTINHSEHSREAYDGRHHHLPSDSARVALGTTVAIPFSAAVDTHILNAPRIRDIQKGVGGELSHVRQDVYGGPRRLQLYDQLTKDSPCAEVKVRLNPETDFKAVTTDPNLNNAVSLTPSLTKLIFCAVNPTEQTQLETKDQIFIEAVAKDR